MGPEAPGGWCPDRPGEALTPEGADRRSAPGVSWIGPLDASDREDLAAWCGVVGPPIVELEPSGVFLGEEREKRPAGREAGRSPEFVVVAWNNWIGGGDLDGFLAEHLGVRCGETGPTLTEDFTPFALLLQEVHRRSALVPDTPKDAPVPWLIDPDRKPHMEGGIVEAARRCGLSIAYVPSARNGWEGEGARSEDKGNAVLSSLPLHQITAIELPFEAGRKVAVAAYVEVPGEGEPTRLDLASVHFDVATTLTRTLLTGNQARHRQARGLLAGMELAGFTGRAAVVAGDFNTWSARDGSLKLLQDGLPDSPPISGEGTRGPFPTDHIFFRGDSEGRIRLVDGSYENIEDAHGSDHNPRILRLRVRGP